MTYREAEALKLLDATIDRLAPKRSQRSDGWIGDPAHASRSSDHNPWVKDSRGVGVVRARDITDDPAGGCDGTVLAASLADLLGKHPALGPGAMVIHNRRIISTNRLREGWRSYSGPNAHESHVHVSVGLAGYDSRTPWPVRLVPQARPSRIALARVLLRAVVADKTLPARRRRRAQAALDALPVN